MKRPRKKIIIALALLAAVGAGAAFSWPRPRPTTVIIARVERLPELKDVVNGTGQIRTEKSVDIQTEIAGVIIELPVREGDRVQKGQVLLRIDPFQTEADVQGMKAQLASLEAEAAGQDFQIASSEANAARDEFLKKSAEVELRQAETNVARSQESYERDRRLRDEKLVSPDQYEISETQLKLNRAQVEAAKAKIAQIEAQIRASKANIDYARSGKDSIRQRVEGARSNLRRSEDLLEKTTIHSTLDGVVVKRNVEAGERAVPGILSNPQATLMTIADLSVIEAEMKIDETDIVKIEMGQIGKISVDAIPDTHFVGRVIEIGNSPINATSASASSSTSQEGKDFKVVLRLENPSALLRPGMSCDADITARVKNDALVIPIQALTAREVRVDPEGKFLPRRPDERPGTRRAEAAEAAPERLVEMQGVFLPGADGLAHFRPIKTGITGEMDIQVLDGLSVGEEVVAGPLKSLRSLEELSPVKIDRERTFRRIARRRKGAEEETGEGK